MKKLVLKSIHFYQENFSFIFRLNNASRGCRFSPSCSEYSCQAIEKYGLIKGLAKSLKRIIKCNPFNKGGIDLC
jgi:putative membrane protein insertion efficiency factor